MTADLPDSALERASLVTVARALWSSHCTKSPCPRPRDECCTIEASPINPSDLGLLIASADMSTGDGRWHSGAAPSSRQSLKAGTLGAFAGRLRINRFRRATRAPAPW